MESGDQQSPENSGDQQGTNQAAAAKSYECTFCKRGFSNAQALGGHMNIHRKDKAKLKQVSSSLNIVETKQKQREPSEIPKSPPSYSQILPKNNPNINSLEAIHMPHVDNQLSHVGQVQLPLFSQAPLDQDHQNQGRPQEQQQQEDQGDQSEKGSDLDLELRLGPQPQDSSSTLAKATTRKFF
ncbi:hypothetical protein M0R45_017257 [Rubus argutus]|uniref:C2H2-type domain-containing protein n=1 Tax=Rubus argutus TaxID=59490 RepID=A0AAW1XXH6_RUBAR